MRVDYAELNKMSVSEELAFWMKKEEATYRRMRLFHWYNKIFCYRKWKRAVFQREEAYFSCQETFFELWHQRKRK